MDFPVTPPREWLFEWPDWFTAETMNTTVDLFPQSETFGRAAAIWYDPDVDRGDGYRPPTPTEPASAAADLPTIDNIGGHEAVESFYNHTIPYPADDGGPAVVGIVPLNHSIINGERLTGTELAARRWKMNADPKQGVLVGRVFPYTVTRTTGPKKGLDKIVFGFLGAVRPGADPDAVAAAVGTGMSGEWLANETYGPVLVNRQGYPAQWHGELAQAAAGDAPRSRLPRCAPGEVCLIGHPPPPTPTIDPMPFSSPAQAAAPDPAPGSEATAESTISQEIRGQLDAVSQLIAGLRNEITIIRADIDAATDQISQHDIQVAEILRGSANRKLEQVDPGQLAGLSETNEQLESLRALVASLETRLNQADVNAGNVDDAASPITVS